MTTIITKDIIVPLENRPGTLAKATEALSKSNVNILGFACLAQGVFGTAHFITNDPGKAESALRGAGLTSTSREAVFASVPNKPGELARVAKKLSDSGVNIETSFVCADATGTGIGLAFQCDRADQAKKVLG